MKGVLAGGGSLNEAGGFAMVSRDGYLNTWSQRETKAVPSCNSKIKAYSPVPEDDFVGQDAMAKSACERPG